MMIQIREILLIFQITHFFFRQEIKFISTVEPCYKEVGYKKKKTSYNKVILLVPALYIYFGFVLH